MWKKPYVKEIKPVLNRLCFMNEEPCARISR